MVWTHWGDIYTEGWCGVCGIVYTWDDVMSEVGRVVCTEGIVQAG